MHHVPSTKDPACTSAFYTFPAAALLAACGAAVLLLAPMINAKSYVQLEDERKLAAAKLA